MQHKIIIIGSWPAGHTAAIYSAKALLEPLMFEGFMAAGVAAGGQLTTTTIVENYPGFPQGIDGNELMGLMKAQSINSGASILTKTVDRVNFQVRPFQIESEGKSYTSEAVILATGATAKRLSIPWEEKFWQKGVSACAVCDGGLPIFRDQTILVIGGGDTAMEEAMHLSHFAKEVIVLVRRDELRASQIMQQRAQENSKISFLRNTQAIELLGEKNLEGVMTLNNKTQEKKLIPCKGLFYAVGHTPNTSFLEGQIELDDQGYIITQPGSSKTNIPGVFAAGDVKDKTYRQAITSAGSGCIAAMDAEKWIKHKE